MVLSGWNRVGTCCFATMKIGRGNDRPEDWWMNGCLCLFVSLALGLKKSYQRVRSILQKRLNNWPFSQAFPALATFGDSGVESLSMRIYST